MLDVDVVELVSSALGTRPGLVEKDWHVVRALGVLADIEQDGVVPVFSGGTSLSKGWGLIQRFSEDIDFRVAMQPGTSASQDRKRRSAYRVQVLDALESAGYRLEGKLLVGNNSHFFSAALAYRAQFNATPGLRSHIRIEMTFDAPTLPPVSKPVSSLIARAQRLEPEIPAFACVDPVETAADKLSALAWRVCIRQRGSEKDDPTVIRHLHDLAALEQIAAASADFGMLLVKAANADTGRGGGQAPETPAERFDLMLERLRTDPLWAGEYETYVLGVSYAAPDERIAFADALSAVERLRAQLEKAPKRSAKRTSKMKPPP